MDKIEIFTNVITFIGVIVSLVLGIIGIVFTQQQIALYNKQALKKISGSNWTITCTIRDRTIYMLCEKGLLIIPKQRANGFEEIAYATEAAEKMYEYIMQKEG